MGKNLRPCVDCEKMLSVTAKNCSQCGSVDPFGSKRLNDKIHLIFMVFVALALLTIGGLWHFDIFNPLEFLKGVFHH